jgi:hypothetical protein
MTYGANQPEYDLMITDGDRLLKVSVKGSTDGGWGLTQTQLAKLGNVNYHGAVDAWLLRNYGDSALNLNAFSGPANPTGRTGHGHHAFRDLVTTGTREPRPGDGSVKQLNSAGWSASRIEIAVHRAASSAASSSSRSMRLR